MSKHGTPQREDTYSPRGVLLGLGVVVLLVIAGLIIYYAMSDNSELQDCVMQGRSNCAPVADAEPRH